MRKTIDMKRLQTIFPHGFFPWMDAAARRALQRASSYNSLYFNCPAKYRKTEHSIPALADCLYPPNAAVIDWMSVKNFEGVLVDRACGLGALVVCLNTLGIRAYGYDTWEQVPREAAVTFLASFKMEDRLVDKSDVPALKPEAVSTISYPLGDEDIYTLPSVKWQFIESNYVKDKIATQEVLGSRLHANYGCVYVFKRRNQCVS